MELSFLGAGDLREKLWPPFSRPHRQQRLHRRCHGENHHSEEQPSCYSAGKGSVTDSGKLSEANDSVPPELFLCFSNKGLQKPLLMTVQNGVGCVVGLEDCLF